MPSRSIKKIIPAQKINMGGHLIDQPLPVMGIDMIDPFLLIHHWIDTVKVGNQQSEMGVGPHPHRGFSPVTFIFKGSVRHQDSIGNNVVISDGGTQWMHAGKGVIHSERPGIELVKKGGDQEFIQFWVNTPSEFKMEAPYYLPITDEDTPKVKKNKAIIGVVAGNFEGVKGRAKTYSPQTLLRVEADRDATFKIPLPNNYNTLLYVLNGSLKINGREAGSKDMVWFENDGEEISIQVDEKTRFIVLSGEPIGEPVVSYGPFVMNTQQEIQQALFDFQNGKMGDLLESFDA